MSNNGNTFILSESLPTRADAVKNRQLLIDTARDLFTKYGVEGVSMTQLAEAAGVGKGTLYRHFSNKTDLCYALLDEEQRDLQTETFEYLNTGVEPLAFLRWFLAKVVYFVANNNEMLSPAIMDGNVSALDIDAHSWWRMTIRGMLVRLQVSGDVDYFTDVLYVMLNVETIHYQLHTLGYDRDRVIDGLLATVDRLIQE